MFLGLKTCYSNHDSSLKVPCKTAFGVKIICVEHFKKSYPNQDLLQQTLPLACDVQSNRYNPNLS